MQNPHRRNREIHRSQLDRHWKARLIQWGVNRSWWTLHNTVASAEPIRKSHRISRWRTAFAKTRRKAEGVLKFKFYASSQSPLGSWIGEMRVSGLSLFTSVMLEVPTGSISFDIKKKINLFFFLREMFWSVKSTSKMHRLRFHKNSGCFKVCNVPFIILSTLKIKSLKIKDLEKISANYCLFIPLLEMKQLLLWMAGGGRYKGRGSS